jgi:hypothetical protein
MNGMNVDIFSSKAKARLHNLITLQPPNAIRPIASLQTASQEEGGVFQASTSQSNNHNPPWQDILTLQLKDTYVVTNLQESKSPGPPTKTNQQSQAGWGALDRAETSTASHSVQNRILLTVPTNSDRGSTTYVSLCLAPGTRGNTNYTVLIMRQKRG